MVSASGSARRPWRRSSARPSATGRRPRPTLAHYLLLSLPVRQVVTTNYDDLLERALEALKRYPVKVVRQEDVARTGRGDGVHVVKLHGDAAEPDEIVLCRDDYDEFFERRPAMALLLEGLLLNRTFFFVGYGLRDPNFRQVYSRIARMLREARRPAFATSFESAGEAGRLRHPAVAGEAVAPDRHPGADARRAGAAPAPASSTGSPTGWLRGPPACSWRPTSRSGPSWAGSAR